MRTREFLLAFLLVSPAFAGEAKIYLDEADKFADTKIEAGEQEIQFQAWATKTQIELRFSRLPKTCAESFDITEAHELAKALHTAEDFNPVGAGGEIKTLHVAYKSLEFIVSDTIEFSCKNPMSFIGAKINIKELKEISGSVERALAYKLE